MAGKKLITLEQLTDLATRVKSTTDELNGKVNAIEIPTNVSELNNDVKYQTDVQVTATVTSAVAAAAHLKYKIVAEIGEINPADEGADQYIYLVPKEASEGDNSNYDEYMVVGEEEKKLEKVGDWKVDLSQYAKTSEVEAGYVAKEDGKSLIEDTLIEKLKGIQTGADHVEKSDINGNIKVDGAEVVVYDVTLDVASEEEFTEALSSLFLEAVAIGESAIDTAKTDFSTFGATTDFYEGEITRNWKGSTCKVTGTLKYCDATVKEKYAGLWTEGCFFAISLTDDFSDKTITWIHGESNKTGSVGDTDLICHLTEETKLYPIIAVCEGRTVATFDVSGLTISKASTP